MVLSLVPITIGLGFISVSFAWSIGRRFPRSSRYWFSCYFFYSSFDSHNYTPLCGYLPPLGPNGIGSGPPGFGIFLINGPISISLVYLTVVGEVGAAPTVASLPKASPLYAVSPTKLVLGRGQTVVHRSYLFLFFVYQIYPCYFSSIFLSTITIFFLF